MNRTLTLSALGFLTLAAQSAFAFNPVVNQTVGTGASESYFVINFDDGANFANNPSSDYIFGYRYDGTKTGQDLLNALNAGVTPAFTFTESTFGTDEFVNSFSYNGHAQTGNYSLNQSYWSYFLSTDARLSQNSFDWSYSSTGTVGRTLSNNSYDGWTFSANGVTPTPVAAPEPGAPVVLAVGVLGLVCLRRRKTTACG